MPVFSESETIRFARVSDKDGAELWIDQVPNNATRNDIAVFLDDRSRVRIAVRGNIKGALRAEDAKRGVKPSDVFLELFDRKVTVIHEDTPVEM